MSALCVRWTDMMRIAAVAAGMIALAFVIFLAVTGGNWRGGVEMDNAYLIAPDIIEFAVFSCDRGSAVSELRETASEVKIRVTHEVSLFRGGGLSCQDGIACLLKEPLGSRTIVDLHAGNTVNVQQTTGQHPLLSQLRDSLNSLSPCSTLN